MPRFRITTPFTGHLTINVMLLSDEHEYCKLCFNERGLLRLNMFGYKKRQQE